MLLRQGFSQGRLLQDRQRRHSAHAARSGSAAPSRVCAGAGGVDQRLPEAALCGAHHRGHVQHHQRQEDRHPGLRLQEGLRHGCSHTHATLPYPTCIHLSRTHVHALRLGQRSALCWSWAQAASHAAAEAGARENSAAGVRLWTVLRACQSEAARACRQGPHDHPCRLR